MKNDPFNIFDEAARRSSGIKKKTTSPPTSHPQAKPEAEQVSPRQEGQASSSPSEISTVAQKVRQLPTLPSFSGLSEEFQEQLAIAKMHHDELVNRLDEIHVKLGMSLKDMKEYLSNSSNFKPQEWEMIQGRRAVLQERILNLLGKEGREMLKKTEAAKGGKARKGKTLGSRKKWIPIK
jgi:hypothetical protein